MARNNRTPISSESTQSHVAPTSTDEVHFLAQALDYYRAVKRAGQEAPFGQFLNVADAAVTEKGRELLRQSLESIIQTEIDDIEKKKESRLCPQCQTKREHLGYRSKTIRTSNGIIIPERRYEKCHPCGLPEYAADASIGLEKDYTVGFLFLAVRAGSRGSYEEAQEDMKVWRGLEVSRETIRMLCHQEAPKIKQFVDESAEVPKDFIAAKGNVEITMDATKVNTLAGWRDMKIGIFSKRLLGEGVDISYWDKRNRRMLPEINACVAFASIEEKDLFQRRVNAFRCLLRAGSTGDISALGDGAEWIWNIIREVFGKVRECLDVYHTLEHLSDTGKVLYKEGTEMYELWKESTKWEMLESGFEKIELRLDDLENTVQGKNERESLRKLRGYLENHRERLCYRERLSEGRAIGSGQVEGACKSMIGRRLKQTGARWRVDRLNEMAVLCSVHYSDLWEKYWAQTI
jgi:hypothetical protein